MRIGSSLVVGSVGIFSLMLISAAPPQVAVKKLTFTKDIAPILYSNCVSCHRPGEVAPFSLLDYKTVKKHADDIATVTITASDATANENGDTGPLRTRV